MNISNRLFCFLMLIIVAILILVIVKLILLFADYARRKYEKYLLELQMNNKSQKEITSSDQLDCFIVIAGYITYSHQSYEPNFIGAFTTVELARDYVKKWSEGKELPDDLEFFEEILFINPARLDKEK